MERRGVRQIRRAASRQRAGGAVIGPLSLSRLSPCAVSRRYVAADRAQERLGFLRHLDAQQVRDGLPLEAGGEGGGVGEGEGEGGRGGLLQGCSPARGEIWGDMGRYG